MKNASPFDQAVNSSSHVAGCVRTFAACCLLGGAVGCAFAGPGDGPAGAGPQSGGRGDMRGQQMSQQQDLRSEARYDQRQVDPRAYDNRDTRADEQRRAAAAQEQNRAESARRNGRMTADERRDLRRQINEAGQDLYANPPRR